MKLYEITGAMKEVEGMLDEGVPIEQIQETLDGLKDDFEEKAKACLMVLSNLDGEITAVKNEEVRLSKRRKSKENQVVALENYLLYNMQELNHGKIDNGIKCASIRKGAPILVVENEDEIPVEYKKINTSVSIDKRELLAALKKLSDGELINGAKIGRADSTLTIK